MTSARPFFARAGILVAPLLAGAALLFCSGSAGAELRRSVTIHGHGLHDAMEPSSGSDRYIPAHPTIRLSLLPVYAVSALQTSPVFSIAASTRTR